MWARFPAGELSYDRHVASDVAAVIDAHRDTGSFFDVAAVIRQSGVELDRPVTARRPRLTRLLLVALVTSMGERSMLVE